MSASPDTSSLIASVELVVTSKRLTDKFIDRIAMSAIYSLYLHNDATLPASTRFTTNARRRTFHKSARIPGPKEALECAMGT